MAMCYKCIACRISVLVKKIEIVRVCRFYEHEIFGKIAGTSLIPVKKVILTVFSFFEGKSLYLHYYRKALSEFRIRNIVKCNITQFYMQ